MLVKKSLLITLAAFILSVYLLDVSRPTNIVSTQEQNVQRHVRASGQSIQECANRLRKDTECIVENNQEICADGWTHQERLAVCAGIHKSVAKSYIGASYEESWWNSELRGFYLLVALVSGFNLLIEPYRLFRSVIGRWGNHQ